MATKKQDDEPMTADRIAGEAEPPASFSRFLRNMSDGEAEAELSHAFQELNRAVKLEAHQRGVSVKGTLSIKVTVLSDNSGAAKVLYSFERKDPKRSTTAHPGWLTDDGNIVEQNPRQGRLGFAKMAGAKREAAPVDVTTKGD